MLLAVWGFPEGRDIIDDGPRGDRDHNDRKIKLI